MPPPDSKRIIVTPHLSIHEDEIQMQFIRSSGPGGQNVNKVASAVQLRFDVWNSPSLPEDVKKRLIHIAGRRMTKDGILIIQSRRFRTQAENRRDALHRFIQLIKESTIKPRRRIKTRTPHQVKMRRLENKRKRSRIKKLRKSVFHSED
ncbi:alternative ribosome rescue aminoacyl-tRNA hydrolase ArfB [bacterium]